jgi:formate hydrogenlyase subunit 6/NADH:ubiquinone oxidoreductase subunit I
MSKRPSYLRQVLRAIATVAKGLRLTARHYRKGYHRPAPLGIADPDYFQQADGPITIQYPMHKVPVPDNGRYRLFMETDDCIGCDKCARVCPVDCITIETFRADGDLGKTSDGTVKRLHLPTFDIDMGKCMYCGLCTTVCPTECLTMTPVYDYSEFDRDNLVYHFGAYSPEKEQQVRAEIEAKKAKPEDAPTTAQPTEGLPKRRPVLRRVEEPAPSPETVEPQTPETPPPAKRARPVTRPATDPSEIEQSTPSEVAPDLPQSEKEPESPPPPAKRPRPVMRPKAEPQAGDIPKADPPTNEEGPLEPTEEKKAEQEENAPAPPPKRPRPIMRKPPTEEGGAGE